MAIVFCKHVYVQFSKIIWHLETVMECKVHGTLQGLFSIIMDV